MTNGEMKHRVLDLNHWELQVDIGILAHDCVAHAPFMGKFPI